MSTAFVVGATGAVGAELVRLLNETQHFQKVIILARRNVENVQSDKFEQKLVDFENLEAHADSFKGVDVGFCALGTTRGKSGANGFYRVDHDYVVNTAKLAKENGVKQFVLVSAGNANESSIFLYPKTKGQVEREIGEMGFEKLVIMQPGLIEAKRDELRIPELIAKFALKPFKLFTDKLSISATEIAKAMILATTTKSQEEANVIWNNSKIIKEAKEF